MLKKLYETIITVLDSVKWRGKEIRMAGTGLGAQVALNLAAMIRKDSDYSPKMQRIALFDPFFSKSQATNSYPFLPASNWQQCPVYDKTRHRNGQVLYMSPSEYARCVLIPQIREGRGRIDYDMSRSFKAEVWDVPVIENYQTSAASSAWISGGDTSQDFNDLTVHIKYDPGYYGIAAFGARHEVGIQMYLHSRTCQVKLDGSKCTAPQIRGARGEAPSALMSTEALKKLCDVHRTHIHSARPQVFRKCKWKFEQTAGSTTTWIYDDIYTDDYVEEPMVF